jgi:hypothetical protein
MEDIIAQVENLMNEESKKSIDWYENHTNFPRIVFRILGCLTIFLSVVIPFIAQLNLTDPDFQKMLITGLSLAITFVTGITTFFKPDQTWKLNMGAKLNLEALYATWKLEILEAKSKDDEKEKTKLCFSTSHQFLEAAQSVTASNTEGFFTNITFPKNK